MIGELFGLTTFMLFVIIIIGGVSIYLFDKYVKKDFWKNASIPTKALSLTTGICMLFIYITSIYIYITQLIKIISKAI